MRRIVASDQDPEQRLEKLLAEQRRDLEEQATRLQEAVRDLEAREQVLSDSRSSVERLLRLGASELDSREAELDRRLAEVVTREERVRADEAEVARRREELGAVELKRAAVERRELAVARREEALDTAAAAPSAEQTTGATSPEPTPLLAFVPGARYDVRELEHGPVRAGDAIRVEDEEYVVARVGPSPLPADARRCAYLVRGPRGGASSDGSS